MNKFNVIELKEKLQYCTFNAEKYFLELEKGYYHIDDCTYASIISHPAVQTYYRRRFVFQESGDVKVDDPAKKYTYFKSVSDYHLELVNGVVFVRSVQCE